MRKVGQCARIHCLSSSQFDFGARYFPLDAESLYLAELIMKPLATSRLIIALCGALLPALFTPFATARQDHASKRSFAIYPKAQDVRNGLIYPNGLALNDKGDLYISDIGAHRVLKLDRRGRLSVIAGTGEGGYGGDGGPATKARLFAPHDLAFDPEGDLLIADTFNHRIRRIDRHGVITTVAGDGKAAYSGDGGPATQASLNTPQGVAFDRDGGLLIADTFNHVVRRVDRGGRIATFAGTVPGHGGDGGDARRAQINLAMAAAVAPDGAVYISDAANSRIRRVSQDGVIQTAVGYGPAQDTYGAGFAGDGGAPAKAKIFSATDLKFDAAGALYISDSGNNRIRVIRDGAITTVAGSGRQGFSGDGGKALVADLNTPQKIAVAKDGSLFIADRANHRVRKVDTRGVIITIAGTGKPTGQGAGMMFDPAIR
jgi:DNA-binding beta-propeller fold protein YncE